MTDSNLPLRKAYLLALSGITFNSLAVPVFYGEAPATNAAVNYIVFGQITSNDASTKNSSDTSTSIQVGIHTFSEKTNSGDAADLIAAQVLTALYPNKQARLTITAMQCVTTEMVNDVVQEFNPQGDRKYVSRFITFRHNVYQG